MIPMEGFRPEHQLNIDDDKPFTDEEPWDEWGLSKWAVYLDGMSPEEKEKYRSVMPEMYRPIFFDDEPFPDEAEILEREIRADLG